MQCTLFDIPTVAKFPSTRYQGSKLKHIDWIWYYLQDLPFDTVLDAFGGTGSVAFRLKQEGKEVTYNDILKFNSIIGAALIENDSIILEDYEVDYLLQVHANIDYKNFIAHTFDNIYYTHEENNWLDVVSANIRNLGNRYKQAIAYFALFQACIIKRPYNLFHRSNLYLRTQEVERSFGNKKTWDTSFETHFRSFVDEANNAVFSNGKYNKSLNKNVFDIQNNYDLVYIDTPYISDKGVGTDYFDFYHFLEGLVNYDEWGKLIDVNSKHKRLVPQKSEWTKADLISQAFDRLIAHFQDSIMAISYRSNGIPSIDELVEKLQKIGKQVDVYQSKDIKYVLSNRQSKEVLIIAK